MENQIQSIPLDNLVPHPDNPNRMSKQNFAKLVRNIKQTGRYEPLIVRPCPRDINRREPVATRSHRGERKDRREEIKENNSANSASSAVKGDGFFQIINGYHRWLALKELGEKFADTIIWDIDDQQTDILLTTLNRLCGCDVLGKKLAILKRLSKNIDTKELAKLLPQTKKQLERLVNLPLVCRPLSVIGRRSSNFANSLVFFVSDEQMQIIEAALSVASYPQKQKTKAQMRAEALCTIAQYYLDHKQAEKKPQTNRAVLR